MKIQTRPNRPWGKFNFKGGRGHLYIKTQTMTFRLSHSIVCNHQDIVTQPPDKIWKISSERFVPLRCGVYLQNLSWKKKKMPQLKRWNKFEYHLVYNNIKMLQRANAQGIYKLRDLLSESSSRPFLKYQKNNFKRLW